MLAGEVAHAGVGSQEEPLAERHVPADAKAQRAETAGSRLGFLGIRGKHVRDAQAAVNDQA